MIWIFDIETYPNYFGVIFKNYQTKELKEFIIFEDRNDLDELYHFIKDNKKWLIGYNSFNYDNQLLNYICINYITLTMSDVKNITLEINNISTDIITISDYSYYKYRLPFRYIDLMKVAYLFKSLKLVGVNLKWHKLQDLPIPPKNYISKDNLNLLHEYNLNDVNITEKLYEYLQKEIKLRWEISTKYNINGYSESRSGLANRLLEKFYSESTGIPIKLFKDTKTERSFIPFKHVIFKNIHFETEAFDNLLESLMSSIYYKTKPFNKKTIIFDGIKYTIGIGGLHSDDKGGIFEETNDSYLIDADVSSMYPSIIINYQIHPAHLDHRFINKYKEIRDNRLKAKHEGNKLLSETFKIVLNAVYGKFNSKTHWLHDPLCMLKTTINGQLFLLMLIEKLVLAGFKVISANTDGIVTIVDKNRKDEYLSICKEWENNIHIELEYVYYKKYIRKDVNNYIAIKNLPIIDVDKDVKFKGVFNTELDILKGFDKPIISLALYEYFINNNKDIRGFIKNHKDIYDFCIAQKVDDKFTNHYHRIVDNELKVDKLQKSVRYYVSTQGGVLYKVNEDTGEHINYCSGHNVQIFNDYFHKDDINDYSINYNYYISEVYKIVNKIDDPQLKLF